MKLSGKNKQNRKQSRERKSGRLLPCIAAGSAACVLVLSCLAEGYLYGGRKDAAVSAAAGTNAQTTEVEFGAVLSEENQAVHSMLNKPAVKPDAGDTRTVFKIVEVIPHEACSVFPYLVEWGSPEAYDNNVTIGYEGLMSLTAGWNVFMFSEEDTKARDSNPFTIARESIQQSKLKNYEVPMGAASNPNGKWYRKTQADKDGMITEDGYFEYVGAGKGLYYLSASYATDKPDGRGIRYETRAVARAGTQSPAGELYVSGAAYYIAKEHQAIAKPAYNGKEVVSRTGYHYDLSFAVDSGGTYAADMDKIKVSDKPEYDYHLAVDVSLPWDSGFTYAAGGNYAVESAVPDNAAGNYVRISDGSRQDGFAQNGLDAGYFRLAAPADGTAPRYKLTFRRTAGGFYYANKPAVWSAQQSTSYYFEYAGQGKGFYDAVFQYSTEPSVKRYGDTLVWVKPEAGRYALTAVTKTAEGNPVYVEKDGGGQPADYTNFVDNFSFHDVVNESKKDAEYNPYNSYSAGLGVNLGGNDSALNSEGGGFIFVPVSDKKDMKETPLSSLPQNTVHHNSNTDTYYKEGDRIYVTGQERRYRYYCRDGFYNNEWFKLLCYSNHPKDPAKPYTEIIDGIGYDYGKTPGENLADQTTKALLEAFNQNMRIEIVQITPEKLTSDDVKSAQLIYLSNQEGLQNLSGKWNQISQAREAAGLDPLAVFSAGSLSSYGDIADDVLMTIYDECIWTRNRALIASITMINSSHSAKTNLEKLGYFMNFFQESRNWAEFLPDRYPDIANDEFSRIKNNADVKVCLTKYFIGEHNSRTHYNWGYEADKAETHSSWLMDYFIVYSKRTGDGVEPGYEFSYTLNWNLGEVLDGETKLTIDYWVPGFLKEIGNSLKIWQILQNSQEDRSTLTIEVINAQTTAGSVPELVVYGDEFEADSFDILYKVNLLGAGTVRPELNVTYEWETGTVLDVNSNASYGTEYEIHTRRGFTTDGSDTGNLNPSAVRKKLVIKAENANGKKAEAEVIVIVREGFDLN